MIKKKISLILAFLMVAQMASSCSESVKEESVNETVSDTSGAYESIDESSESESDAETRPMHSVPDELDYGGETFNVLYPNWQGYNYYFFASEYTGDVMNDAIFNRKSKVEDALGITMTETCPGNIETIFPTVSNSVKSDDDAYQLVLAHCINGIASLVRGGLLYNFDDFKYTDIEAPWWNHEMMNELRLGKKHITACLII